jgi:ferredoxin
LTRRGFLVAAGTVALGLAGVRWLIESRRRVRPGPARVEPAPRTSVPPSDDPPPAKERRRLRAHVTEYCFACGLCVLVCPEVFAMGERLAEVIVPEVPEAAEERSRQAARDCPAQAIVLEGSAAVTAPT